MELIPAIDLLGGRVVRLVQGAHDAVTSYDDDPVAVARHWEAEGASRLHLVDLDGAREGRPSQAGVIASVVEAVGIACQIAGGLRTEADVARALSTGAERVVLGSALIADPGLAIRVAEAHGHEALIAALDVLGGRALGDAWVAAARGTDAVDHARRLVDHGVVRFAVTAIAHDGMLIGPDLDLLAAIGDAVPGAAIIASGGVGRLEDIRALARRGFEAAILGRSLYEGTFELGEALAAATAQDDSR
jgi:phosphoribosylformimino-5-aminoimidazole carboxamide ribotide isomerase